MPIKEVQARNASPKAKPYKLADGEGLFLLVKPNGSKLWRMKYRFAGKEKLLALGAYPETGLADAREKRLNAKHTLLQGQDPMAGIVHTTAKDTRSFERIAKLWHENRVDSLDPAHASRVWSRLERDVLPVLGAMHIEKITPPDVLAMIRKIEARGALDISRRAKQCVGQVFQFAIASGWATTDPTTHLRGALKPKPRVEHMGRLPMADLPHFLAKLDRYNEENPRRQAITRSAVRFALLTWVRTKELRFAARNEFEGIGTQNAIWRIPADRMKMKREHIVPLSEQAEAIVTEMLIATTEPYVFPGVKPLKPLSENTMIYALYRMGYISRQTVHGFRSLASTWANEQLVEYGNPPIWMRRYHEDWVEMQLAHSEENEVRGAYNAAEYLAPRRRMLQDWADFLDAQTTAGLATLRYHEVSSARTHLRIVK
ncbi:MAG: tyrosine-type recombinase/integrase [Pseudomonadota bacterium]